MPITNLAGSFSDNLGQIPGVNALGESLGLNSTDFQKIRKTFLTPVQTPKTSGNGVTDVDDPTYLGFTLLFNPESPLFNGATRGSAGPLQYSVGTGEDNNSIDTASAIGYLNKIGETNRAEYLRAFVQGIRQINTERPYYWQSVSGVAEAWKSLTAMGSDPYVGSKDGEGISIACLEAIDLKLTALFSMYKLAVYDSRYKRFVLPKNLMYFDVDLIVTEIRQFKKTINYLGLIDKSNRLSNNDAAAGVVNENASFVKFRFKDCMWVPEESGKVFDSISNAGGEVASTSIKWSYSNVLIDSQFAGYDKTLLDSRQQTTDRKTEFTNAQDWANFAKDQAAQISQQALQSAAQAAERAVLSQAQGLLFGNVHGGVQNSIANVLQNSGGALVNATIGGVGAAIQQNGSQAITAPIQLADNIMPAPAQAKSSLPTEKIQPAANQPTNFDGAQPKPFPPTKVFGPGPSGPAPLEPNNVHG